MSKIKPSVPETKIKEPSFIRFSEVQKGYLQEVVNRQRNELNGAVQAVYKELGILEEISNAPQGKYRLRMDFSGLDVLPIATTKEKETESKDLKSEENETKKPK